MATITVTAVAGRVYPVHASIATAPGGALLLLRPGDELEVDGAETHIQRALRPGADLVIVTTPRARPTGERFSPAPAAAPATTASPQKVS